MPRSCRATCRCLSYAKQLFSVPQALGQAAGAASLPFLASLFGREGNQPFAKSVNESVSRIVALSFLLTAWMVPMGGPAVDFFFRGGRFHRADTGAMALYFAIFALSLCFWSAQAIYARAFYATSNTLTPMIAATVIVLAMLPVYALLFHAHGAAGLAFASDIGIAVQATVFAWMLHRRGLAPVRGLDFGELGRSLLAAAIGGGVLAGLRLLLPARLSRLEELGVLVVSALVWMGLVLGSPAGKRVVAAGTAGPPAAGAGSHTGVTSASCNFRCRVPLGETRLHPKRVCLLRKKQRRNTPGPTNRVTTTQKIFAAPLSIWDGWRVSAARCRSRLPTRCMCLQALRSRSSTAGATETPQTLSAPRNTSASPRLQRRTGRQFLCPKLC